MTEKDILCKKLSSVAFAMFELRLFQNTHPDSVEAAAKLRELEEEYKKLKKQYEKKIGPLFSKDAATPVEWIKGPWPWEV